jgi:hypothetical protein
MTLDIDRKMTELKQMTVKQLQNYHLKLFGENPRSRHKQHLLKRIAWRLQALAEGDLTDRARHRAKELACDADMRVRAPRQRRRNAAIPRMPSAPPHDSRLPMPGTLLARSYKGETLQVKVLEDGFEYDGKVFASLTAVVKRITGQHWNGFHFFGLSEAKKAS